MQQRIVEVERARVMPPRENQVAREICSVYSNSVAVLESASRLLPATAANLHAVLCVLRADCAPLARKGEQALSGDRPGIRRGVSASNGFCGRRVELRLQVHRLIKVHNGYLLEPHCLRVSPEHAHALAATIQRLMIARLLRGRCRRPTNCVDSVSCDGVVDGVWSGDRDKPAQPVAWRPIVERDRRRGAVAGNK